MIQLEFCIEYFRVKQTIGAAAAPSQVDFLSWPVKIRLLGGEFNDTGQTDKKAAGPHSRVG